MLLKLFAIVVGGSAALSIVSYAAHLAREDRPATHSRLELSAYPVMYFAPGRNLEAIDIPLIQSARTSLDIAMYAFTDRRIAAALVDAAGRGVQVRIYRDQEQFLSEQARGGELLATLAGHRNIRIRVKASRELMHEKAFVVDGRVLREGSANWSISAERYQDNEIAVTANPLDTAAFEANFASMWTRVDNEVVQ